MTASREDACHAADKDDSEVRQPRSDLVEFSQASPLTDVELDLERARDTGRAVDLSTTFGVEIINPWPDAD